MRRATVFDEVADEGLQLRAAAVWPAECRRRCPQSGCSAPSEPKAAGRFVSPARRPGVIQHTQAKAILPGRIAARCGTPARPPAAHMKSVAPELDASSFRPFTS